MAAEPHALTVPDLDSFLDDADRPPWAADAATSHYTDDPAGLAARFRVESQDQAEWAMRKLRRAHLALSAVQQTYAERVALLDEWLARAQAPHAREVDFFAGLLEDYGRRCREADDRTKTIPLVEGDIKTTRNKPKVELANPAAALAWALEHHPEIVTVPPAPDPYVTVTALRAVVQPPRKVDEEGGGFRFVVVDREGTPVEGVSVVPENVSAKAVPRGR